MNHWVRGWGTGAVKIGHRGFRPQVPVDEEVKSGISHPSRLGDLLGQISYTFQT